MSKPKDYRATPQAVTAAAGKVPLRPRRQFVAATGATVTSTYTAGLNDVPSVALVLKSGARLSYGYGVAAVHKAAKAAGAGQEIEITWVAAGWP